MFPLESLWLLISNRVCLLVFLSGPPYETKSQHPHRITDTNSVHSNIVCVKWMSILSFHFYCLWWWCFVSAMPQCTMCMDYLTLWLYLFLTLSHYLIPSAIWDQTLFSGRVKSQEKNIFLVISLHKFFRLGHFLCCLLFKAVIWLSLLTAVTHCLIINKIWVCFSIIAYFHV